MQSCDGDPLVPINRRIEIAWSRYINLKRILTSPRVPRRLRLQLLKASVMSMLLYGCESWKLTTYVQRKQNKAVSKMLSRFTGRSIAEEARTASANILMNMRDRRWSCLGHVLRMDEDRLVRKVLLNCVKAEKESLYGNNPNLNVEIVLHCFLHNPLMRLAAPRRSIFLHSTLSFARCIAACISSPDMSPRIDSRVGLTHCSRTCRVRRSSSCPACLFCSFTNLSAADPARGCNFRLGDVP